MIAAYTYIHQLPIPAHILEVKNTNILVTNNNNAHHQLTHLTSKAGNYSWEQYIHPEDRSRVLQLYKKQCNAPQKTTYTIEYRLQIDKNKIIWCIEQGKVLEHKKDKLILEGYLTDITALKATTPSSPAERCPLLNEFVTFTWVCDKNGQVLEMSDRWHNYTGQPLKELLEQGWFGMLNPKDRIPAKKSWLEGCKKKATFRHQWRIYNRYTEEYHSCMVRAIPILDDKGEIHRWFGAFYDQGAVISTLEAQQHELYQKERALKIVQLELKKSEAKFKALIDSAPISVVLARWENNVIQSEYTNQCYLDTIGYTLEDAPSAIDWLQKTIPDPKRLEETMKRYTSFTSPSFEDNSLSDPSEMQLYCKDGQYRWFSVFVSKIDKYYMIMFMDISAQKQAEQKWIKLSNELEQRIEERTQTIETHKKLLEIAIEGGEIGTWNWDIQNERIYYNKFLSKMLEISSSKKTAYISTEDIHKLIHPEDQEDFARLLGQHLVGENDFLEKEQRLRTMSGNWLWVKTKGKIVEWDETGLPMRMAGVHINMTKQKEQNLELRRNNLRLELFSKSTKEGILIHQEGTILEVNDTFQYMTGYTEEELIGQHLILFVREEDLEKMQALLDRKEPTNGRDFVIKRKNGTILYIQFWADYLDTKHENIRYIVIRDITERKKYEQQLQLSETKYRTLFSNANDAIFIMDGNFFIDCNEKTLQMFGCELDDIINHTPYAFSPKRQPDGKDSMIKAKEKIQSALHGKSQVFYWKHRKKNGLLFDAEVSLNAVILGGKQYIQALVRDITQQKRYEEALQIKNTELAFLNRRSEAILSTTNEAIITTSTKGIIEAINPVTRYLFGYTSKELIGHPISLLVPNADNIQSIPSNESPLVENEEKPTPIKAYKNNGQPFWVAFKSKEVYVYNQKKYVYFIRDVSSRVKAENEIQLLIKKLQSKNKQLNCLFEIARMSVYHEKSIASILEEAATLIPSAWRSPEIYGATITYKGDTYGAFRQQTRLENLATELMVDNKIQGTLEVFYTKTHNKLSTSFSDEEKELIYAIGLLICNIIEKKQNEERMIASILEAEDRERSRIAKDLHDSLGQLLTAISFNLEAVKKDMDNLPQKKQTKLRHAIQYLKHAIQESRSISHNLMPKAIEDYGYSLAVQSLLEGLQGSVENVNFHFYTNLKGERLPTNIELTLYRITQEAINNALKHAKAENITIQLMRHSDVTILMIEDDGKGMSTQKIDTSKGLGIRSMQNRANAISADFFVDSRAGRGTNITIEISSKRTTIG